MSVEQKQAPAAAPAAPREGREAGHPVGGREAGHPVGGRREGGPGGGRREGGPGGPGGPRRGKRQYFRKKKVCKFCVEKMDFIRLQARRHSGAIRPGTRQDSATAHDRGLFAPSALARRRHQARPQHCPVAVCRQRGGNSGASPGRRGPQGLAPVCWPTLRSAGLRPVVRHSERRSQSGNRSFA